MAEYLPDQALEQAQDLVAQGKLEEAIAPLHEAVESFETQDEPFGLIIALKVLSETQRDLNRLEPALLAVRRAHEIFVRVKPGAAQVGDFATEIGSIYAQMGALSESHRWYSEGLKEYQAHYRPADIAHNLMCLAGLARQSSDTQTALALLMRARDTLIPVQKEHSAQLSSLLLALSHTQLETQEVQEAIASCQEAIEIAKKLDHPEILGEGYQALALAYVQAENFPQAIENIERAVHIYTQANLHEHAEFAALIHRKLLEN